MSADRSIPVPPSPDGTITYRGRRLEEVLPKIREELGPDAVIERRRSGLIGGVAGFFQREMVEVDARPGDAGAPASPGSFSVVAGAEDDEAALRAATAPPTPDLDRDEGLSAPAMQRIVQQSGPFADLLADAETDDAAGDGDWEGWAEDVEDEAPAGPAAVYARPEPRFLPAARPTPVATQPPAAPAGESPERPRAAAAHEQALTEHGVSPALATAVVDETLTHVVPFAAQRGSLKRHVRATLARRIPVQSGLGRGRTIALVGPAGAGKTRAAAGLAAAYAAASSIPVTCLSLRPPDVGAELAGLLEPHAVAVRPVDDGAAARAQIGAREGEALVVIDTPAVSPRGADEIARLAGDLRAAGVTETHLVLPATVAGAVARAALTAFAPLDPAGILLTHADETDHLGPLVELAIDTERPLSYVVSGPAVGSELVPADRAALAARLLP